MQQNSSSTQTLPHADLANGTHDVPPRPSTSMQTFLLDALDVPGVSISAPLTF